MAVVVTQTVFVAPVASGNVMVTVIHDLEGQRLVSYAESGGVSLKMTYSNTHGTPGSFSVSTDRILKSIPNSFAPRGTNLVGFTPKMNQPIGFNLNDGSLTFYDYVRKTEEVLPFRAQEISRAGDRFYVKNGTRILELEFTELPTKTLVVASREVANVLEMASHLYEGVAIQNMLGSVFVSIFPRSKAGYQVRIPELDAYKILDAKFEGGVMMVVGANVNRQGQYDRLVFRFDSEYQGYDLRVVSDISPMGLNFVTLDSGICVCLTEEEKLEAFSAKKDSHRPSGGVNKGPMKVVDDEAIDSNMKLLKVTGKVGFERGGKIYIMSLK